MEEAWSRIDEALEIVHRLEREWLERWKAWQVASYAGDVLFDDAYRAKVDAVVEKHREFKAAKERLAFLVREACR